VLLSVSGSHFRVSVHHFVLFVVSSFDEAPYETSYETPHDDASYEAAKKNIVNNDSLRGLRETSKPS